LFRPAGTAILAINYVQKWGRAVSETRWPLHRAKDQLSAVIEAAQAGEAQLVTRHSRPVAVVISFEEYTRLKTLGERSPPSFARQLLALPQDDGAFEPGELELRPFDV
jgi:antitoxin Phd